MPKHLQTYYLVQKGLLEARKIYALVRKDKYDKLAADLQDLLIRNWTEQSKEAIRDVVRALNNRANFTDADLDAMVSQLEARLGAAFAAAVKDDLLTLQASTYAAGMKEVLGITPSFNVKDAKALAALERYALYPVLHHFDDQLQSKVREFGNKIISDGLNRTEAGKLFEAEFAEKYSIPSFRYWQGYSNHVVTQSREFGRVSAYEVAEVEYAEVRAILDHRTTEICRHMHGRRIKVSEQRRVVDAMIANEDPDEVANIVPWPSASEISQTKSDDLPDGALLPPFHFNCRTRTVMAREVTESNAVESTKIGKSVSKDDKKKLNSLTDEEYSNWMQTIRSKRALNFGPEELDKAFAEFGSGLNAKSKDEYLKAGRGIIRNANGVMARVNNTADGKRQFEFHFFSDAGKAVVGDDLNFHAIVGLSDPQKAFAGSLSGGLRLDGSWNSGK